MVNAYECNCASHAISLIAKHAGGHLHLRPADNREEKKERTIKKERDTERERERERERENESGRGRGRGPGLLMALIVQMKSETIHLHNKHPSRSSVSSPTSNFQVSSVESQVSRPESESKSRAFGVNVVVSCEIILIHVVGD